MSAALDLSSLDGLFVGLLTGDELKAFDQACRDGSAFRSYEGGAGLMGLATVRIRAIAKATPPRESNEPSL